MSLTFSVIAVSLGGPPDFFASFLFLFHFVAFGIAQSSDGVVSAREVKKKKKGAILLSGDATNMTPLMTTSTERETLTRHQNVHLRPSRWKLRFSDGFFFFERSIDVVFVLGRKCDRVETRLAYFFFWYFLRYLQRSVGKSSVLDGIVLQHLGGKRVSRFPAVSSPSVVPIRFYQKQTEFP